MPSFSARRKDSWEFRLSRDNWNQPNQQRNRTMVETGRELWSSAQATRAAIENVRGILCPAASSKLFSMWLAKRVAYQPLPFHNPHVWRCTYCIAKSSSPKLCFYLPLINQCYFIQSSLTGSAALLPLLCRHTMPFGVNTVSALLY